VQRKVLAYIQHVPFEEPAHIITWATSRNWDLLPIKLYESINLPEISQVDVLVIMGGPMSVNDDELIPWLQQEKAFIATFIATGKPVLGICLGAQLIASVLGAKISKNPEKELGWWPIQLTDSALDHPLFKDFPSELTVFHWHGETFSLPENSSLLMSSEACSNQAFLYQNHVLGLQFHFELDNSSMEISMPYIREEWQNSPFVQEEKTIKNGFHHMKTNHHFLEILLNQLFETTK
jgi:GMP synthase-like glutamine amidotransferase